MNEAIKKRIILNVPYFIVGAFATNIGEAYRLATGSNLSEKIYDMVINGTLATAFQNPSPSIYPTDLLIGIVIGLSVKLAVYIKGKDAKQFRHGEEYGSARWGTAKDIEPYIDPKFQKNVLLSKTERLTMDSRPKNPKYARNKNVLVIGGSGSGKTRFFIKPNMLQAHSSYVLTDPKGTVSVR